MNDGIRGCFPERSQERHEEGTVVAAQAVGPLLGASVTRGQRERGEGRRGPELEEGSVIRLVCINHWVS